MKTLGWRSVGVVVLMVLVSSCFAEQSRIAGLGTGPRPGFLLGFWHGFVAPISFVVSLFSEKIRIYAVPNTGKFYDLGFMLGISGFSGGIFAGSKKKKRD